MKVRKNMQALLNHHSGCQLKIIWNLNNVMYPIYRSIAELFVQKWQAGNLKRFSVSDKAIDKNSNMRVMLEELPWVELLNCSIFMDCCCCCWPQSTAAGCCTLTALVCGVIGISACPIAFAQAVSTSVPSEAVIVVGREAEKT